jgi:lipoic acid synthetase
MGEQVKDFSSKPLEIIDWGRLEYGDALVGQEKLAEECIAGSSPDRLVLVEHPPVVTIGRSGGGKDLRISEQGLRGKGIALHYVDRGGMATFHGPGQLVAYPILKLRRKDLHLYMQSLLETTASVLQAYGLEPQFRAGEPGVWLSGAKVASMGIAVRKWVTYHGIALNVNTDPTWFKWIVPCGHANEKITSMDKELGHELDMEEVKGRFIGAFCRAFAYDDGATMHKHPAWLVRPAPETIAIGRMERHLRKWKLATVCESAHCPNLGECFSRGTATFMILGTRCTRRCRFCAVEKGAPLPVDLEEPERVAQAAQTLGLKYVVVTSVTRDDLIDGGSVQFARTIECIHKRLPDAKVEVLVPDFRGSVSSHRRVCEAHPDVFNHNIETVARLYPRVRPQADYRRSLAVLEYAARQGMQVKSGLMLGLGESYSEIEKTLTDLKGNGCDYLTIGQYLSPSKQHLPVARYVPPPEFESLSATARAMGFRGVVAGPLVRSSYKAEEMFQTENELKYRGKEGIEDHYAFC